MAVTALHRCTGRCPNMSEERSGAYLGCDLAQVPVVPRRLNALEDGRLDALAVPANPEAVAIGRFNPELGVQALVDDRMVRAEQQLVGDDRVSRIGHPSTHGLSEACLEDAGITLDGGYRVGCQLRKKVRT